MIIHWNLVTYLGLHPWRKTILPFPEAINCYNFLARSGTLYARSSFQASISLAWTCTDLMCAFSTSMYSCVQLSYSVWKTYFLVLIYHPWHVQSFCLFSHNDSWAFGRWCDMHVSFMNKNSTVSYSLYFYKLWVSVIITMYYKTETSLALLSIFGSAVQETPKTACCYICYPP